MCWLHAFEAKLFVSAPLTFFGGPVGPRRKFKLASCDYLFWRFARYSAWPQLQCVQLILDVYLLSLSALKQRHGLGPFLIVRTILIFLINSTQLHRRSTVLSGKLRRHSTIRHRVSEMVNALGGLQGFWQRLGLMNQQLLLDGRL